MKIPYPANLYVINTLKSAIGDLEKSIKSCGELQHPETKLPQKTKDYFEKKGAEDEKLIAELRKIMQEITE